MQMIHILSTARDRGPQIWRTQIFGEPRFGGYVGEIGSMSLAPQLLL